MATPCEALQFPPEKSSTAIPTAGKDKAPALSVALAGTQAEVRQCQRLRLPHALLKPSLRRETAFTQESA